MNLVHATLVGDAEVAAAFMRTGSRIRELVDAAVIQQAESLQDFIQNEELSGQMLGVRTGKRRTEMRYLVKRTDTSIAADVHPKPNSALWILGSGFGAKEIWVNRKRDRRLDTRAVTGRRVWVDKKTGKVRQRTSTRLVKGYSTGYKRMHHIHQVPFMSAAFASHRDVIRGAIEGAVAEGTREVADSFGGAEGI